jgi:hypothetical protein
MYGECRLANAADPLDRGDDNRSPVAGRTVRCEVAKLRQFGGAPGEARDVVGELGGYDVIAGSGQH